MTVKKLEYNDNESRINNVNNSKTENKHYDANKTYILCRKAREKQHYSELIFDSAIVSKSMCFLSSRDLHRHTNKVSSSQKNNYFTAHRPKQATRFGMKRSLGRLKWVAHA